MEHPRLCGVKLHYSHYSHPIWIDPRLRGVSLSLDAAVYEAWVHPRLRGVKVVIMKENALDIGTPPLTRGKGTKYEKIENVSPGTHQ